MTPEEKRARHREDQRKYRSKPENREKLNARQRAWRAIPENRARDIAHSRIYGPERRRFLKSQAIGAYGGACACCGETEMAFLTIDHIDGGGNEHRREIFGGRGGGPFYRWLAKEGFPPGFQVLCFNCNLGKHLNGVCPHQQSALRLIRSGTCR